MPHNHKHCAHTHLSFCQLCQVVYCHDCSDEWRKQWPWPWQTTGTITTGTYGLGYKTMTNAECPVQVGHTAPHTHGG